MIQSYRAARAFLICHKFFFLLKSKIRCKTHSFCNHQGRLSNFGVLATVNGTYILITLLFSSFSCFEGSCLKINQIVFACVEFDNHLDSLCDFFPLGTYIDILSMNFRFAAPGGVCVNIFGVSRSVFELHPLGHQSGWCS